MKLSVLIKKIFQMKSARCFPIGLNFFLLKLQGNAPPIVSQVYNHMIKLNELFIGMLDHGHLKYVTLN